MDIILKENVDNLGYKHDLVTVKDGYARNYLIPKGLAIYASPSNLKMREETLKQRAHKEEKLVAEAGKLLENLQKANITVGAKVGENGKIFGSVNSLQLADALKKAGFEVARKNITIKEEPIKSIGKYSADIKGYKGATTTIEFEVVED